MNNWLRGIVLSGMALSLAGSAVAQTGAANARSLAMGGAYSAVARGVEAPRWNPANLGLYDAPAFSMNLVGVGAAVSNNSFSKKDYDLYNGAYLTPALKTEILNKIPDDGLRVDLNSQVELLGFSWRRLALSLSAESAADLRLSRSFMEVALNGNQLDKVYDFSDTGGEAFAISKVGLSYGHAVFVPFLRDFAIGATLNYVQGLAQAQVVDAYGVMGTTFDGSFGDARARVRHSRGGSGFAADLGIAAVVNERLRVGVAIRNLWSSVQWKKDVKLGEYGVRVDSLTVQAVDESSADSLIDDYSDEYDGDPYSASLPAELCIGGAYRMGRLLVAADYVQGFSDRPGVSRTPMLAVGTELRLLSFLPLRLGVAFGGNAGTSSGAGFGLRLGGFEFNVAASNRSGLLPGKSGGLGFALGMRIGV